MQFNPIIIPFHRDLRILGVMGTLFHNQSCDCPRDCTTGCLGSTGTTGAQPFPSTSLLLAPTFQQKPRGRLYPPVSVSLPAPVTSCVPSLPIRVRTMVNPGPNWSASGQPLWAQTGSSTALIASVGTVMRCAYCNGEACTHAYDQIKMQ
jgi:hypothetical protein